MWNPHGYNGAPIYISSPMNQETYQQMNQQVNQQLGQQLAQHVNAVSMPWPPMNGWTSTLVPVPFNMQAPPLYYPGYQQPQIGMIGGAPYGFAPMPNITPLPHADYFVNGVHNGPTYYRSAVMSMSSGLERRPEVYQANCSSATAPGNVRETRVSVQDSRTGVMQMAIGHQLGERSHVIEKEKDMRSGQLEEREEFINLAEEQAEQFNDEFIQRVSDGAVTTEDGGNQAQHPLVTIPEQNDDDEEDEEELNKENMAQDVPKSKQHPFAYRQLAPRNRFINRSTI